MKVFDPKPSDLIETVADTLKQKGIPAPAFADWVKTGPHRERAPTQDNWYYLRMGSILYRLYKNGASGTGRLATYYGGRKARGTAPHEFRKAGRKVIRVALQELEKQGFIQKAKKGRTVSPTGEKFLSECAKRVTEYKKKRDSELTAQKAERAKIKAVQKRIQDETRKAEARVDKGKKTDKKEKPKA